MANEERDESFAYANQLVTGSVLPMTMQAAIELGVFKIIAKAGPGAKFSASEIAAQLPATKNKDAPMMLDRILRLLASHGVVECSLDDIDGSQRLYGQSNVSRYFVPNEDGVSLGPLMALIQDKWILHDWSDEHCLKLLKNCYKSIPEDGKVIVVESILPDLPETSTLLKRNSQIDVLMMTQNPGGKEQTKHEFMTLATGAGFSGIRFECFTCNLWVMEFYK
ncbi:Flavone 3'-O-methyltransferase 1 [Citrus sinensis]|nr:Flavone 3'-O-methyltransferase 1 [Citrus sinensis]